MMMDGLHSTLRTFLECKGPPTSYNELVTLVKHFEQRGLQRSLLPTPTPSAPALSAIQPLAVIPPLSAVAPVTIPTAPESLTVNYASSNEVQSLQAQLADLTKAMKKLSNNDNRSTFRGNRNVRGNSRSILSCGYCGRPGHFNRDWCTRIRDEGGNRGNTTFATSRGGHTRSYGNYRSQNRNYNNRHDNQDQGNSSRHDSHDRDNQESHSQGNRSQRTD